MCVWSLIDTSMWESGKKSVIQRYSPKRQVYGLKLWVSTSLSSLLKKGGGGHLVYSLRMDGQVGQVRNLGGNSVQKNKKALQMCVLFWCGMTITCLWCDLGVGMNKKHEGVFWQNMLTQSIWLLFIYMLNVTDIIFISIKKNSQNYTQEHYNSNRSSSP